MKRKDNVFSKVFSPPVESNSFDLSHDKKLTFNMGELIPVNCIEVLPGDSFNISFVNMLRFLPLVAPVMHKVRVHTDYFFVPNRLLWDGWEDFITGKNAQVHPFVQLDSVVDKGTVGDYLGIPPGDYSNVPARVNAFQIAAYYKIYDDWYRDQNLILEKFSPLVPGSNGLTYLSKLDGQPLKRAWEHDYFTSALPTTQQGVDDVSIPLTFQNNIPVELTGFNKVPRILNNATGGHLPAGVVSSEVVSPISNPVLTVDGNRGVYDPDGSLTVDIQSDAATINDLREAFSLQAFLERSIRGGVRYIEQIWSHFNVKSSDARLQRAEYIGRDIQTMTISEVLATAQSSNDGSTAQIGLGSMGGHGISVGGRDGISYRAEEHGFIFGIMSVIPDTAYQNGIAKQFTKGDRLDYAWPSFAHLGEQEVYLREIQSVLGVGLNADTVFGYMPRYSEYRYLPSQVCGDFRDNLAFWTLGRVFDDPDVPPTLSEEFVECNPRLDIFAVTDPDVDHVIGQVINKVTVYRKLPRYGVPSTL